MNWLEEVLALGTALRAANVEYAFCGEVAAALHGDGRAGDHIDLMVERDSVAAASVAAATCGFHSRHAHFDPRAANAQFRAIKASPSGQSRLMFDLLMVNDGNRAAWETRTEVMTPKGGVFVVSRDALYTLRRLAGQLLP